MQTTQNQQHKRESACAVDFMKLKIAKYIKITYLPEIAVLEKLAGRSAHY